MENFPTLRSGMLPRVANVVTLAVMVAATWWSSEQRPVPAVEAATIVSPASPAGSSATPIRPPAPGPIQASWPSQTSLMQDKSIKPASFGASLLR